MIGRLRGVIVAKQPPWLLIEVGGVGYEVEAPLSTFEQLPAVGGEAMLHTHLIVREDAQLLCGFAREGERALFRRLIRVSGVGAKLALAILSGMNADEFARCVQNRDSAALTRLPGIGKKTAERLVVELADALGAFSESGAPASAPGGVLGEAQRALETLGYKPAEATRMLRGIEADGLSSEVIIRQALRATLKPAM